MSSWSNVSIHTEKHTVLIPKQQFILQIGYEIHTVFLTIGMEWVK